MRVDRNTAVGILIVVVALAMILAALSSSWSFNREVTSHIREEEARAAALAAPSPVTSGPSSKDPGSGAAPSPGKTPEHPPTSSEAASDLEPEPGGRMALQEVGRRLVLSPEVRDRLGAICTQLKQDIFDLINLPRPDGTSLAGEIVEAWAVGPPGRVKELFGRLPADRIPGSEITYAEGAKLARARSLGAILELLGPKDFDRFRELKVDPEDIDTGFDAWGRALMSRARTR